MPHPQPRTRARTRRFTACNRHPTEPVTGFCALCLRDRLAGLESSSAPVPELRRSKSVVGENRKIFNDLVTDRRNSCDVRVRNTLFDLFVVDDTKKVELMNLGLERKEGGEEGDGDDCEVRVSDVGIGGNGIEVMEGDLKTMKEMIDMELRNRRWNLGFAPSVFTQKLRKWRQKQKEKKERRCINGGSENVRSKLGQKMQFRDRDRDRDSQSEVGEYGLGRRSCDTEPRFSIDAHRLSVEDPRLSLDEHRASWDGYMVARTIPRLTPMLSVVDSMVLASVNRVTSTSMENLQMHSISEDGSGSGSGTSAQSNSDSSNSNRRSSSSSMKSSSTKTEGFGGDDVKSTSNARVSPASDAIFQGTKLVITEKELKDWHLNSIKNKSVESVSNEPNLIGKTSVMNPSNEQKKKILSNRWRKVCNLWGHKQKPDDRNGDKKNLEHIPENRVEIGNSSAKLVSTPYSIISRTRRDEFVLDRNRSTRYSTSDLDSGLLRLYLTPFRNSRRSKSGKSRAPSMVTNGFQLH